VKDFTAMVGGFLWLLAVAMTGCNSSDVDDALDEVSVGADSIRVSLQLRLGDSTGTRASSFEDEAGTGIENYIDPSRLRILFFNTNGRLQGVYRMRLNIETVDQSPYDPELYYVVGKLVSVSPDLPMINNCAMRVVVEANWSDEAAKIQDTDDEEDKLVINRYLNAGNSSGNVDWYTPNIYKHAVESDRWCMSLVTFLYDTGIHSYEMADETTVSKPYMPSKEDPIPMYGVKYFSNLTFAKGNLIYQLGTIDVLRSVVKITVRGAEGIDLTDVKLTNTYRYGFSAPLGIYDNMPSAMALSYMNVPMYNSLMVPATIVKDYPFTYDEASKTWVAYVHEYNNVNTLKGSRVQSADHFDTSRNFYFTDRVKAAVDASQHDGLGHLVNYGKWNTDEEARISLKMITKTTVNGNEVTTTSSTKYLRFKDYDDPNDATAWDLMRNTHYDFIVEKGKFSYVVVPWDEQTSGDITFE
jgi:hypothetical protein